MISDYPMDMVSDENARPSSVNRRQSNLMLLTGSRAADIKEREATVGAVKPEMDPFWEARSRSKTEKLMHNAVTEGFKTRAVSRLHESTTAFSASTRVKAYDEKIEGNRGADRVPKVREGSNVSTLKLLLTGLGPTPAIIQFYHIPHSQFLLHPFIHPAFASNCCIQAQARQFA